MKSETTDEKIENAPDPAGQSRFFRWLGNLWYHYKWHIIIATFFLAVLIVALVQCNSREHTDLTVAFAGGAALTEAEQHALCGALESVMPADFDGNGKKKAELTANSIYTDEELRSMYSFYDEKTQTEMVDLSTYQGAKNYNQERFQNVTTYLMTGECAIWLVSPYVYEQTGMQNLAVSLNDLSDLLANVSYTAYDGYAVRLADTDFYRSYQAVQVLPEDTLLVLIHVAVGQTAKESTFNQCKQMYRAILQFQAK